MDFKILPRDFLPPTGASGSPNEYFVSTPELQNLYQLEGCDLGTDHDVSVYTSSTTPYRGQTGRSLPYVAFSEDSPTPWKRERDVPLLRERFLQRLSEPTRMVLAPAGEITLDRLATLANRETECTG